MTSKQSKIFTCDPVNFSQFVAFKPTMNALRENKLSDKLLQARIIVTAGKEDKYRQSMIQQVALIRIRVLEVIWMEISWWVKQPARIVSKIYSQNLSYLNFLKEIAEKKAKEAMEAGEPMELAQGEPQQGEPEQGEPAEGTVCNSYSHVAYCGISSAGKFVSVIASA